MKTAGAWGFLMLAIVATACKRSGGEEGGQPSSLQNLTQYVDPYIGTGDHGHVFVGANVPFGLVQVGPTVRGGTGAPAIISRTRRLSGLDRCT